MTDLKTQLAPISRFIRDLDLSDAHAAEAKLNREFPPGAAAMLTLRQAAELALKNGEICNRENDGIKFSRVSKPQDDPGGCSIDAVYMDDAQGPVHTHTKGEVCLCLHQKGAPAFDGRSEPWVVMPAGSRHRPTVSGGAMLILYWWPEGAVDWK
jgi:hypothetical protein